nr:6-carboxyhexanoate--CoA ligase [uncultured Holophaga sp.]
MKMRAAEEDRHVSGAERILTREELEPTVSALVRRALTHTKGDPDRIHLKIERLRESDLLRLPPLPVRTVEVATPEEGHRVLRTLLDAEGLARAPEILARFPESYGMRGAMLLDVQSLRRLEPDPARGVRATYMDYAGGGSLSEGKQHFREALALATKVAAAPGIVGELCISDDPDYVTGYFASPRQGYIRITRLKEPGDANGGRLFLFDGKQAEVGDCIRFLQERPVLLLDSQDEPVF